MAIKIQGTTVIDDSRNLVNIVALTGTTINATTVNTTEANFNGTGAIKLPSGTTANQPASPTAGLVRYNSDINSIEYYNGTKWVSPGVSVTGKTYFLGTNG